MILKRNQIRIVMAILVSQFLLVSLLSGFLYIKASHTLKVQSEEYYASMMHQLNRLLDHTFREVENVITGVSHDSDLYDYPRLMEEREWIRILRTYERIDALVTANQSIYSIQIYYREQGKVLDSRKGLIGEDEFYDRDFLHNMGDRFIYPDWSGPRVLHDDSIINPDDGRKVLTVVKPLGYISTYSTTSIVVNIPWEYLENVIEELGFHGETGLYLFKDGARPIPLNEFSEELGIDSPSLFKGKMEWNGTAYLTTSLGIPAGWTFVSLIMMSPSFKQF